MIWEGAIRDDVCYVFVFRGYVDPEKFVMSDISIKNQIKSV